MGKYCDVPVIKDTVGETVWWWDAFSTSQIGNLTHISKNHFRNDFWNEKWNTLSLPLCPLNAFLGASRDTTFDVFTSQGLIVFLLREEMMLREITIFRIISGFVDQQQQLSWTDPKLLDFYIHWGQRSGVYSYWELYQARMMCTHQQRYYLKCWGKKQERKSVI